MYQIGWVSDPSFLDQTPSEVMQKQNNPELFLTLNWKFQYLANPVEPNGNTTVVTLENLLSS